MKANILTADEVMAKMNIFGFPANSRMSEWKKCPYRHYVQKWLLKNYWEKEKVLKGMFIFGPPGTGKTHLLYLIAKFFIMNYYELGRYVKYGKMTDHFLLKSSEVQNLQNTHFLMLDDIMKGHDNEYKAQITEDLIDYRMVDYLPTFVTSNYSLNELQDRGHKALVDRFSDKEYFTILKADINSIRKEKK